MTTLIETTDPPTVTTKPVDNIVALLTTKRTGSDNPATSSSLSAWVQALPIGLARTNICVPRPSNGLRMENVASQMLGTLRDVAMARQSLPRDEAKKPRRLWNFLQIGRGDNHQSE